MEFALQSGICLCTVHCLCFCLLPNSDVSALLISLHLMPVDQKTFQPCSMYIILKLNNDSLISLQNK